MPWRIQGCRETISCWAVLNVRAKNIAIKRGKPVRVTYVGRKPRPNTRIDCCDFMMRRDGSRNPMIDPTWHAHKKKGKGR